MSVSRPLPVRILGTGEYQPTTVVASTEFDRRWGKPAGWTERHTGIDTRRIVTEAETTSHMGELAARAALEDAALQASDIDCVISACSVMEQAIPCTAALIQRRLNLHHTGIPAFDVNATCLSALTAMDIASNAIALGRYRRVLVVSSEIASCGLDADDRDTAALFGDGAAAVIVGGCEEDHSSAVLAAHFESYTEGTEFCQVRIGGTRLRADQDYEEWKRGATFEMNGKATYRLAARHLPGFLDRLLARAGVTADSLRAIVPHQASGKALSHLQRVLNLPGEKLVRVLSTRGNQIAASIPVALHHARTHSMMERGDLVALVGSGAGLSLGGIVLRY